MDSPISVVMSVYNDAIRLQRTIESVLGQSFGKFEFVIVNDGSTDAAVAELLGRYERYDRRIRVFAQANEGITTALVHGCSLSRGQFVARIDNGDVMAPDRLARQLDLLELDACCVAVTSRVEFCGPEWEHLWIAGGVGGGSEHDVRATPCSVREYSIDVPHHGATMFRKSAYLEVGGYRREFYFGQDWDLWYRLAERGRFHLIPEVLYRARIFPRAISMAQAERQREIAECSLGAAKARMVSADERPWLDRAASIRPLSDSSKRRVSAEPGFYFVGEALRRNGDPACRRYLANAVRERPLALRSWVRLVQSLRLSSNSPHGRTGKARRG